MFCMFLAIIWLTLFNHINTYDFHQENPNLHLEGGDIIVFNKDILFIGMSERTNKETINALLPLIFNQGFKKTIHLTATGFFYFVLNFQPLLGQRE